MHNCDMCWCLLHYLARNLTSKRLNFSGVHSAYGAGQFLIHIWFQWNEFLFTLLDESSAANKRTSKRMKSELYMRKKIQCHTVDTYQAQSNSHFPNRMPVQNKHDSGRGLTEWWLCINHADKCMKKNDITHIKFAFVTEHESLYIWSTHSVTVLQSQRTQHNVNSFQCNVLIYRHEFVFDFCARACKIYVRYRTKEMIFRCMNKKESCNRPSHHKLQLRREWIRSFSIALLISFSNAIV